MFIDGSNGGTDNMVSSSLLFSLLISVYILVNLKFIVQVICVVRFLPMLCNIIIIIHSSKKNEKEKKEEK